MKRLALAAVLLLSGCGLFRAPVEVCPRVNPPAELLRVPEPLPPLPVDLPSPKKN